MRNADREIKATQLQLPRNIGLKRTARNTDVWQRIESSVSLVLQKPLGSRSSRADTTSVLNVTVYMLRIRLHRSANATRHGQLMRTGSEDA